MKTKQQAKQARNLQAAKKELKKEKSDLKATLRLTPDAKLSSRDKRRLAASVSKAKRDGRLPKTAQQTIPYQEMCRDGICIIGDRYFTRQIQFYDVNYQLAQNEDKNLIFENYCDFLNYFDSSIKVQLSFLNQRADMEEYQKSIHIPEQADAFNGIRREYSGMLKGQLARGNNGLTKTKYITFGIEADSLKEAKPRLERIEADVLANFKVLGVRAHSLDGYERLAILHRMFHPADNQKFKFAWDAIWKTGLSSKDFIAPDSFTFKSGQYFQIGRTYGAVSFLQILAPELTDRTALEIYVTGSLNVFNHQTNVEIKSRIVCYVIKNLGKQLKKFGMQVVQDQVWGRVSENREAHKSTRLYIDEMHLLLREEQTAAYTVEIWKRFRKWGGIPTGITQNVKDLLASREIANIFENSDFIYMLNQAGGDRQILAKQLNISPHQLGYVTNSNAGEGLLFYGNVIIPFVDHFPKDTELYSIMTTRPEDLAEQ